MIDLKTILLKIVADVAIFGIVMTIVFSALVSVRAEGASEEPEEQEAMVEVDEPAMIPVEVEVEEEPSDEPATSEEIDIHVEEELEQVREDSVIEAYDWAYVDPDTGKRTDITPEGMILVEDALGDKPAEIVLAIAMVETRGQADLTGGGNGMCQITGATGKEIWTKMMDNSESSWNRSLLFDGETNMEMAAEYINYLWERHDSIEGVLDAYHGNPNDNYKKKISSWLEYSDMSFEDINKAYFQ